MTDPVIVQFEVSMSQLVKVVSEAVKKVSLTVPLASAREIYAAVNASRRSMGRQWRSVEKRGNKGGHQFLSQLFFVCGLLEGKSFRENLERILLMRKNKKK